MIADRSPPTIILITDPRYALVRIADVVERVGTAIPPGALLVQLRDKLADAAALRESARVLRETTTRTRSRFVVNASSSMALCLARDVGADGAHVPAPLLAEARAVLGSAAWISTPAHTDVDVATGARAGANAVLVSPIWATPGKGSARGTAALEAAQRIASLSRSSAGRGPAPSIHALGGVDESRAAACAEAGADGVAAIRAILDATDPGEVARRLDAPFRRRRGPAGVATEPGTHEPRRRFAEAFILHSERAHDRHEPRPLVPVVEKTQRNSPDRFVRRPLRNGQGRVHRAGVHPTAQSPGGSPHDL